MPVNPPRPPTTTERIKQAEYELSWFIERHATVATYAFWGVLSGVYLFLTGTDTNIVAASVLGYLSAGIAVLLPWVLRK